MMKVSRGALAAIAAALVVPAGVAIAHNYDKGGWSRLSPEARARLDEGKLAMAKTALKLNAEQEKLWAPVEAEVRATLKMREERRLERDKMREEHRKARDATADGKSADVKMPDMADRIDRMSQRMGERAERMKSFAAAFKPFYASLTNEQKEVLRPLARDLMGGEGRGHGGPHGKRWAMGGGWGEGGRGWGHHGGHHRGGPDREAPNFRDDGGGPGGPRDGERGPPAEQFMPDMDAESPATSDSL